MRSEPATAAARVSERLRSKTRTALELAPLLVQSSPGVAYIGWLGHDNLGDDAIFEACRRELAGARVVRLPRAPTLARLSTLAGRPIFEAGLLGGGTVVGWPNYRSSIDRLRRLGGPVPMFALGVGVLDPDFDYGPLAPDLRDELRRWGDVLGRFARVSVRGRRSQELLASVGVEARVVGDTALLLADEQPRTEEVESGLLGINVGVARSIWGRDPERVLREVVAFGRDARRRGWRLRLFSVWPGDDEVVARAASALGTTDVVDGWRDLGRALAALRECQVFVGMKLHSVVLASAVHVPSLMLEYQPKCREFQESLGREQWSVRADRVRASGLAERVHELAEGWLAHREALTAAVGALRGSLRAEVGAIATAVRSGR